jgi:putative Mn2+ efflux pump MntP
VAFGLLAFIGGKMIYEAFAIKDAESRPRTPQPGGAVDIKHRNQY